MSPDGTLQLVVTCEGDDWTIGFQGTWHTHGDVLAAEYLIRERTDLNPCSAVERLMEDLVHNRSVIAIAFKNESLEDAWATYEPEEVLGGEEQTLRLRYWNGMKWRE
jgi:hypothetical protein